MTFGLLKSIIEKNLLESYKDSSSFKKAINEFKINVLNNKNLSKVYSIYDELTKPQGLSTEDAKDFLEEGLWTLRNLVSNLKMPKNILETKTENKYRNIDLLLYPDLSNLTIKEKVQIKKEIIKNLSSSVPIHEAKVNLPLTSMVKIANQTLHNYLDNLDENSKKEFFELIKEDSQVLESKFESLKTLAVDKLSPILENEKDSETKKRISETIDKIKRDRFDQITYLKLKNLVESI
jgi:hypothetical protein